MKTYTYTCVNYVSSHIIDYQNVLITCNHHQGNLTRVLGIKQTAKLHKWTTQHYSECLRLSIWSQSFTLGTVKIR